MPERPKYQVTVLDRVRKSLARYAPIIESLQSRSANESDTVAAITDMLADTFGWAKYTEITSEMRVKGQYCDLALRRNSTVVALLEAKSVKSKLSRSHLFQAVSYAANQGVDWVMLVNGRQWQLYRVVVDRPIDQVLIAEFDALDPALRDDDLSDMDAPWLFCREAFDRGGPQAAYERISAINGASLAEYLLSTPVLKRLRLEIREHTDFALSTDELEHLLCRFVLRPEVVPQVVRPGQSAAGTPLTEPSSTTGPTTPSNRTRVGLGDLFAAGLIADGETLTASYKGHDFSGVFRAPASLDVMGSTYDSLSEASLPVVRSENPDNTGRNGWTFWFVVRNGEPVSMSQLRDQLSGMQPGAAPNDW